MVQVNTSGEESKFGVSPGEACIGLARHVHQQCQGLRLVGLMTIGMAGILGGGEGVYAVCHHGLTTDPFSQSSLASYSDHARCLPH